MSLNYPEYNISLSQEYEGTDFHNLFVDRKYSKKIYPPFAIPHWRRSIQFLLDNIKLDGESIDRLDSYYSSFNDVHGSYLGVCKFLKENPEIYRYAILNESHEGISYAHVVKKKEPVVDEDADV